MLTHAKISTSSPAAGGLRNTSSPVKVTGERPRAAVASRCLTRAAAEACLRKHDLTKALLEWSLFYVKQKRLLKEVIFKAF